MDFLLWHKYDKFTAVNEKPELTSKITEGLIFDNLKMLVKEIIKL